MDYGIFPLLLIIVSLAVIVIVVARKFPQLSLLDVENLPEVKEEKKKEEYMKRRVQEKTAETQRAWSKAVLPLVDKAKQAQLSFRQYVGAVEKRAVTRLQEKRRAQPLEVQYQQNEELRTLLADGELLLERGDFDGAESKYIAAIKIDAKKPGAYRGLGDVYAGQKHWKEATETYQFLLHIDPKNEHALLKLADIAEMEGQLEQAVQYYEQSVVLNDNKAPRFWKIADLEKTLGHNDTALEAIAQAVELEPDNPKYLDFLTEISILLGDKAGAQEAVQRLRMVNPDNQKLAIFKEKIEQLTTL